MSVNKIILIGNCGKDPEVREFDNGKMATFTLATSEKGYTRQNGTQVPDHTDWHNCVCFGRNADFVAGYIRKGAKLYIEGKVRYRSYTDKNNAERWVTEIVVDRLDNLSPKPQQQGYPQTPQPQGYGRDPLQDFAPAPPTANDIPAQEQPLWT